MLHHETVSEITPLPVIPRQTAPPAPEELARAVVAVESNSQDTAQSAARVTPQALAACGVEITPEQLLAEVQAQRLRLDQEATMTRQKLRDTPFWLLAGGAVISTLAAVFLLLTSYVFAVRMRESNLMLNNANAMLNSANEKLAQNAASPNVRALMQEWAYKSAAITPSTAGTHLSSARITTSDAYESVWWYYADKAGYSVVVRQIRSSSGVQSVVPGGSFNGVDTKNGQTSAYHLWSPPASPNHAATFTRVTGQGAITATLTYDAARKETTIDLIGSAP